MAAQILSEMTNCGHGLAAAASAERWLCLKRNINLRFRRIERITGMSDVLRAVEYAKCKSRQEIA